MLARARQNELTVQLSAYSVAVQIKGPNNRQEGAWAALALEFLQKQGCYDQAYWPQGNMSLAKQGGPVYLVQDAYVDLDSPVYDRDLSFHQRGSLLLNNTPVASDYMWWGHSVLDADIVDLYPNKSNRDPSRYGIWILNSWGDEWGEEGFGLLKDGKQIADNSVGILIGSPSKVVPADEQKLLAI
jgi:hypothetical protein